MRVIEEKMLAAVRNNRNFCSGNTQVSDGNVYLHGIKIAEVTPTSVHVTNCGGWRSVTTKSRLNALLELTSVYVFQRDYEWFYRLADGTTIDFEPKTFDRV